MEADAKAYSSLNKPQHDAGCDFARSLKISEGGKMLDMGFGTGDVTNFIASVVGPQGEVVGVDPDEARIKIAQEKFKNVNNLHFIVGNSPSLFPHDEQEYYDLHFSSSTFHWCIGNQKNVFLEKAYQCLKPGGRLAVLTCKRVFPVDIPFEYLTEIEYKQLFETCSFHDVRTELVPYVARFRDVEEFKAWFKATYHRDLNDMGADSAKLVLEKLTKTEDDGNDVMELYMMFVRLIAIKTA